MAGTETVKVSGAGKSLVIACGLITNGFSDPSHHGGIGQGPSGGQMSLITTATEPVMHNATRMSTMLRHDLVLFFMANTSPLKIVQLSVP